METKNLFGWSDATWQLLDQLGILAGDFLVLFSIGLGVLGWVRREEVRRWFRRNSFPSVGSPIDRGDTCWDAIVFTVSRSDVPSWVMKQLRPSAVAWVATEQSSAATEALRQQARHLGANVRCTYIVNADDPADSKQAVRQALALLRADGCKHLAVDVTGGKTPMSLGGFMAAEEMGADTIYVASEFDAALKRPRMESARIVRVSGGGRA